MQALAWTCCSFVSLEDYGQEECAFSGRWCTTYVISHNATNRLGKKHRRIDGPAAIGDYLSPSIVARADLLRTGICMPLPSLPEEGRARKEK